jgi:hypothetical protein
VVCHGNRAAICDLKTATLSPSARSNLRKSVHAGALIRHSNIRQPAPVYILLCLPCGFVRPENPAVEGFCGKGAPKRSGRGNSERRLPRISERGTAKGRVFWRTLARCEPIFPPRASLVCSGMPRPCPPLLRPPFALLVPNRCPSLGCPFRNPAPYLAESGDETLPGKRLPCRMPPPSPLIEPKRPFGMTRPSGSFTRGVLTSSSSDPTHWDFKRGSETFRYLPYKILENMREAQPVNL